MSKKERWLMTIFNRVMDFSRYMEHFNPVLLKGLVGHDNAMVFTVAMGVVVTCA